MAPDTAWIVRELGRPDSIHQEESPVDPGAKLATWDYREFSFLLTYSDTAHSVQVRTARFKTRRNVGVGSTAQEVLTAYGTPSSGGMPEGDWQYLDPEQELHYLAFTLRAGRVIQVAFGYMID